MLILDFDVDAGFRQKQGGGSRARRVDYLVLSKLLEEQLGLPAWFIVFFVQPLMYFFAAFVLRELVLRLKLRGESSDKRRRRWRRVSAWVAALVAIVATGIAWRGASLDWLVAELSGDFDTKQLRANLQGAIYALLATAILVLFLLLIRQSHRALLRRLDDWMKSHDTIGLEKAALVSRQRLRYTFQLPYADRLMPYLSAPVAAAAKGVVGYLPSVLMLVVIVAVARYLVRVLRVAMKAVETGEIALPGFDPEWGEPTFRLMRIVVILATIVVSYPYLPGAGSEVFKGFSVFIGAVITLGSTAAINNIISGVVLTYTRAFRVGDRVKIGDTLGDITEKGLFVTRIRAPGNEMITIPNGKVLAGDITNLSDGAEGKGLSVFASAGIGYDVDWRKVHAMMKEAARNTSGVEAEPDPFVIQTDLGNYAVSYLLIAKTVEPKLQLLIQSELRQNVLDVFNREGIEIMTPSVSALRDANRPAIPADFNPSPLDPPGLQILSAHSDSK